MEINLDRFSQDIVPAYPAEEYIPEYNPRLEKEAEIMSMAQAAVKAMEAARVAVGDMLNYVDITIEKGRLGVLVSNLSDLDQVPGEVEISDHVSGPFTHVAKKEFEGVVFFTYVREHELQCPLEHSA